MKKPDALAAVSEAVPVVAQTPTPPAGAASSAVAAAMNTAKKA